MSGGQWVSLKTFGPSGRIEALLARRAIELPAEWAVWVSVTDTSAAARRRKR